MIKASIWKLLCFHWMGTMEQVFPFPNPFRSRSRKNQNMWPLYLAVCLAFGLGFACPLLAALAFAFALPSGVSSGLRGRFGADLEACSSASRFLSARATSATRALGQSRADIVFGILTVKLLELNNFRQSSVCVLVNNFPKGPTIPDSNLTRGSTSNASAALRMTKETNQFWVFDFIFLWRCIVFCYLCLWAKGDLRHDAISSPIRFSSLKSNHQERKYYRSPL